VGLRYFTIVLPDAAALAAVVERIQRAGVDIKEKEGVIFLRDPARNGVVLATRQSGQMVATLAAELAAQ
jgi:hypothetical protein